MTTPPIKFRKAVEVLARHHVDFIVVGGFAAVLEGAPVSTFDLDIVPERSPENISRLIAALREMKSVYRDPAGRRIQPKASLLAGPGHNLLVGIFGPLDVLGTIGRQLGWKELLPRSHQLKTGKLRFRVLDLEAVIDTKEQAGREKDLASLPILRKTLELRRNLERPGKSPPD